MRNIVGVRVPDEVDKRLNRLAQLTGRSKSYYIREALVEHLAELEDIYLADHVTERIRKGQERTYSLDEAERLLGLAD